jgi:hypothetical protein
VRTSRRWPRPAAALCVKRERLESEPGQFSAVSTNGGAESLTAPEPPASTNEDIIVWN